MYYVYYLIVKLLSCIPFGVLYVLSDLMYYPLYYVIRYRRRIVRKNLTESFPDKSLAEIISIERKFYHFFMDMILESCKVLSISEDEMKARMKFVNIDVLNEYLQNGKSVSTFIGHYGNWEWLTSVVLWLCKDSVCVQVYHKLVNASMDKLIRRMRERNGGVCVEMRKTARFVTKIVNEGKPCLLALIADQSPKRRDIKHYVNFLNHNVPVVVGSEKLTKHYGYMPFFVGLKRVRRGYYECEVTLLHDNPTALPDYELSDLYFRCLEEEINSQPECYLWTHNRFKYAKK